MQVAVVLPVLLRQGWLQLMEALRPRRRLNPLSRSLLEETELLVR